MKYIFSVFLISAVFYSCFLPAEPFPYDPAKAGADIVERIDISNMVDKSVRKKDFYKYNDMDDSVLYTYDPGALPNISILTFDKITSEMIDKLDFVSNVSDYHDMSCFDLFNNNYYFIFLGNYPDLFLLSTSILGEFYFYKKINYQISLPELSRVNCFTFGLNNENKNMLFSGYTYDNDRELKEIFYSEDGDILLIDFIYNNTNISEVIRNELIPYYKKSDVIDIYYDFVDSRVILSIIDQGMTGERTYNKLVIYEIETENKREVILSYLHSSGRVVNVEKDEFLIIGLYKEVKNYIRIKLL